MDGNRISEFLENINSEKWNCVYQANGMTLLTTKEYDYRYEERVNLQTQLKKQQEIIDKINNYLNNYDVFKVFSFPLMKRWEEEQVKSSIEYEFKTSLIKDLKEILEDKEV